MENSAVEHKKYMVASTASDFGCVLYNCLVKSFDTANSW
jgi:hypothetical protein